MLSLILKVWHVGCGKSVSMSVLAWSLNYADAVTVDNDEWLVLIKSNEGREKFEWHELCSQCIPVVIEGMFLIKRFYSLYYV